MSPSLAPADLLNRVERDVQRALQRSRNGLRYAAGTQRPKVGRTPKDVVWRRHKVRALALPLRRRAATARRS